MDDKCPVCGEDFARGIDGVVKCKNGHEKRNPIKHYSYPLGDTDVYKKSSF